VDPPRGTIRVTIVRRLSGWQLLLVAVALIAALTLAGAVGRMTADDAPRETAPATGADVPASGPPGHVGDMHHPALIGRQPGPGP